MTPRVLVEENPRLLHVGLADDLAAALANGERRAEAWLRGIGAAPAVFLQPQDFANLNTLQELRARDAFR